jgi:hypothetical protein
MADHPEVKSAHNVTATVYAAARLVLTAALCVLAVGCSQWETVDLDAGVGVSLPMLGISVDPHVRVKLGRVPRDEEVKDLGSGGLSGDERLALLRLLDDGRLEGQDG